MNAAGDPRPRRFLALGDSYTIGEGVRDVERWPERLVRLLRERGVPIEDPLIVARTGWTTDELSDGIASARPRGPFDLVTLLIGVNDQFRGRDVSAYVERFDALLRRAIELADGSADRVIVMSIPDWGVTRFAAARDSERIAGEIDAFNVANRSAAQRVGANYVDVTAISRRAGADAGALASDGLHPSGAMHAKWAEEALPTARRIAALPRRA